MVYNRQRSTATTSACAKSFLAFPYIIISPHYNSDRNTITWQSIIPMKYELNLRTTLNFPSLGPQPKTLLQIQLEHDMTANTVLKHYMDIICFMTSDCPSCIYPSLTPSNFQSICRFTQNFQTTLYCW